MPRTQSDTGYSSMKRGYKRAVAKPRRAKVVKSEKTKDMVKREVMKLSPNYHRTIDDNTIFTTNTFHNLVYGYNVTAQVSQGVTVGERQGDAIYIAAMKIRGFFQSATTASAYQYRILVGWSGEEYNTGSLSLSNIQFGDLFLPSTGTNWTPNAIVNPKAFTVLYDQTVDVNSQVSGAADIHGLEETIPINAKFLYQSAGAVYGKNKNLYVVVMGAVNGGTVGGTATGTSAFAVDLIFKNL